MNLFNTKLLLDTETAAYIRFLSRPTTRNLLKIALSSWWWSEDVENVADSD